MKIRIRYFIALALTIGCNTGALAHPALFSDLTLAEAKAQAKQEGKLLLVDFTASWCPPCGEMDKTTWQDPKVVNWIRNNAIAVQIDVDKEQNLAREMSIVAMPSLVVFKDSANEADRTLGFQDSDELLNWLKAVKSGVTAVDRMQKELNVAKGKGGSDEMEARYELARAQLASGRYEDARDNFIWVWQNMAKLTPELAGVRLTFLASEISDLIAKYPSARNSFVKLRDEAQTRNLADWVTLNQMLGDDQASFEWFDKVKHDPAQSSKLKDVAFKLEPLLIRSGRWADAAVFIKEPLVVLKHKFDFAQEMAKETGDVNPFPEDAGRIYACLLAAGRNSEADKVAAESLKLENTTEVKEALVFYAASAGQITPTLKARLDEVNSTKTDASGYQKRAAVYLKLKAFDQALANLDKAIELSPSEPASYDTRESVYCQLKQFDRALSDANHVISIYPKSARSYVSRGFIYMKQKDDARALADFEEAIRLNPNEPLSHINESAVYMRMGKYQLAFDAAERAVKLDPNNAGGICNRGEAAFKLGRYDDALTDLSRSIEMGRTLCGGENFYYRSKVYDALGKAELAKQDQETASKLGFVADAP